MSKQNAIVDVKVIAKAVKDAAKVKKIQDQINKLRDSLYEIEKENRWMNYLGQKSYDGLTSDQEDEFAETHHILNYATRID